MALDQASGRGEFVDVGEGESLWTWTSDRGDGAPLVFLHGFMGSSWESTLLAPFFPDQKIMAIDLPGHGKSKRIKPLSLYTIEGTIHSLMAWLHRLDTPVHLCGYSMGGRVALSFACAYPHMCRTLSLISSTPGIENDEERASRKEWDQEIAARLERSSMDEFLSFWDTLPVLSTKQKIRPAWRAKLRTRASQNDPLALASSMRLMGTGSMNPLWDKLSSLNVPTLLVTGGLDPKFTTIAQQMKPLLPCAEHLCIDSAGHTVHLETPQRVAQGVSAWIDLHSSDNH